MAEETLTLTLTLNETPLHPEQGQMDLEAIKSRIVEISKGREAGIEVDSSASDVESLLEGFKSEYQVPIRKLEPFEWNMSALDNESLDLYLDSLKKEISSIPEENSKLTREINRLMDRVTNDKSKVDGGLEESEYLIKCDNSQSLESVRDIFGSQESRFKDFKYEMVKLGHQMKENEMSIKELEDLKSVMKSVEILQGESVLSEIRVLDFKDNCLRLFIKGPIPNSSGIFFGQKYDFGTEPNISDHELIIEFNAETTEVKKLEIFPNDLQINEIFDTIKSSRDLSDIVRLVQYHIILSAEKRSSLKDANKSRR
ncbi:hypothetical protein LUZ60_004753 [Juncus effusus]|nr:hypothetical protein LUZ60_004753 [Juncus effusus]